MECKNNNHLQHTKNLYNQSCISIQLTISMVTRDLNTSLFCIGELYQSYGYEYAYQAIFVRYMIFYYFANPFLLNLFDNEIHRPDPGELIKQILKCKPDMLLVNMLCTVSSFKTEKEKCDLSFLKKFKIKKREDYPKLLSILYHHPNGLTTISSIIQKSRRTKRYISIRNSIKLLSKNILSMIDFYFYATDIYLFLYRYKEPKRRLKLEPLEEEEILFYNHKSTNIKRRRMIGLHKLCFHRDLWGKYNDEKKRFQFLGYFWKDGKDALSKYWQIIYDKKNLEDFEEWVTDKYGDHDETWQLPEKRKSHSQYQYKNSLQIEILNLFESVKINVKSLKKCNGILLSQVKINELP